MTDEPEWVTDILSQLEPNRTETVREAVTDVVKMCEGAPTPTGWVDNRKWPNLTVYVLHGDLMHILSGEVDREPDQRDLNATAETQCTWCCVQIGDSASCSMRIVRSERAAGRARRTYRVWGAKFGDEPTMDLALAFPGPEQERSFADPTPFAHALLLAITRAQATRGA